MNKEATLDAVEKVIDVVDEQVETLERVTPGRFNLNGTTKKQQITILAATAIVSALAGGGLTYILTKKKLRTKYERIANQEIEEAKHFYKKMNKVDDNGEPLTPEQVLEQRHGVGAAADALRSYQGVKVDGPVPTEEDLLVDPEESAGHLEQVEGRVVKQVRVDSVSIDKEPNAFGESIEVVQQNIFSQGVVDPDMQGWDYETELARRSGEKPYIITHDEFMAGEKDYEQTTLTYFEADDVLIDDKDVPVPDSEGTVGDDNLVKFGHGSKDKNIVYVRNDRLELDFEIARSNRSYAEEVLGFIEHSDKPGVRRFRGHDD